MTRAQGSFELASWDEETFEEREAGSKLTRASVTQTFSGDIEGDGSAQWLMAYRADGTAYFVGLQSVRGTLGEYKGSFVLDTRGEFEGGVARWTATVVPGSGTDELTGLSGDGTFEAPHGSKAAFDLNYTLR